MKFFTQFLPHAFDRGILRVVSTFYRVEDSRRRSRMDRRRYGVEGWVDGWILIYIVPASGRGFAFAKQGNKMRRLRRRTRERAGL